MVIIGVGLLGTTVLFRFRFTETEVPEIFTKGTFVMIVGAEREK